MTYAEKLKDPRWQKKRLEILQRDNWTCQYCGDKEATLHVHHFIYEKGKEPWEYDNKSLLTLCETCHEMEASERPSCEDSFLKKARESALPYWVFLLLEDRIDEIRNWLKVLREDHQANA